jgi:hypothetical protein
MLGAGSDATARVRLTMLSSVAGAAALLLGVVGVYSVVAYAASARVREFGIRIALGAAPTKVGCVGDGRDSRYHTIVGLVTRLARRVSARLPYEVKPTSVVEFGMATGLLLVVSCLVCQARRGVRGAPHPR